MLTLGLNATGAPGYVALGFPSRPGRMTDSNAFLLSASSAAANGAQLQQYYLAGERQSGMHCTADAHCTPNSAITLHACRLSRHR